MKKITGYLLILTMSAMSFTSCNNQDDEMAELLLGLGLAPESMQLDLRTHGLSINANRQVGNALNVLGNVSSLLSLALGIQSIVQMFSGGTQNAPATVEDIRALLDQQTLNLVTWITSGDVANMYSNLSLYVRPGCLVNSSQCNSSTLSNANTDINIVFTSASNAFNKIDTADTAIGAKKLQLVPTMMEAGSLMLYALQEKALIDRENGASANTIKAREENIADQARVVLEALDRAEVLLQKSYRDKLSGISVHWWNCFVHQYCFEAKFTDENGQEHKTTRKYIQANASPQDPGFQVANRAVIATLENLKDKMTWDYYVAKRATVFGSEYEEVRRRLIFIAGHKYTVKFKWQSHGHPDKKKWSCVKVNEPADPHTWHDNFFCSSRNLGMRWTYNGTNYPNHERTQITEGADPHTWNDNYISVPKEFGLKFQWKSNGQHSGMQCTQWLEAADPHTWHDNYLCHPKPFIGYRTMRLKYSGNCLDVSGGNGAQAPANVHQWRCLGPEGTGELNQRWRLVWAGGGKYKISPESRPSNCLVSDGSAGNGANVSLGSCSGTNANYNLVDKGDGFYQIKSSPVHNKCVDGQPRTQDGTNFHNWTCNNSYDQQLFSFR